MYWGGADMDKKIPIINEMEPGARERIHAVQIS